MSINDLTIRIHDLKELRIMKEQLEAEITAIEDSIKEHMTLFDVDTITTAEYVVTWKPVQSTRLDTTALKKELPDIASRYSVTTTTRRFLVK